MGNNNEKLNNNPSCSERQRSSNHCKYGGKEEKKTSKSPNHKSRIGLRGQEKMLKRNSRVAPISFMSILVSSYQDVDSGWYPVISVISAFSCAIVYNSSWIAMIALIAFFVTVYILFKLLLLKRPILPSIIPFEWLIPDPSSNSEGPLVVHLLKTRSIDRKSLHLIPWKGLLVNESVNLALEDILNQTIDCYIKSWYDSLLRKNFKLTHVMNDHLVQEIKTLLRYLISNLVLKIKDQNVADIIIEDMMKSLLNHHEEYIIGKRNSKSAKLIEAATLHEHESNGTLHPAVESRAAEVKWLQRLSELILPHLIPSHYLNAATSKSFLRELLSCSIFLPTFDIICDPDIINSLILALLNPSVLEVGTKEHSSKLVELLHGYSITIESIEGGGQSPSLLTASPKLKMKKCHCNRLGISLKQVLSNEKMLFLFMQYLKQEAAVNLIQFLLTVDALTNDLINPGLKDEQVKHLFQGSLDIYHNYMSQSGVDCIRFKNGSIVEEMKRILFDSSSTEKHSRYRDVEKLRTSEALFSGREEVYKLLENHYLPSFFESSSFLKLVAGPRWPCYDEESTQSSSAASLISNWWHGNDRKSMGRKVTSRNHHRRQTSWTSNIRNTLWPSANDGIIPSSRQNLRYSASFGNMQQVEDGLDVMEALSNRRSSSVSSQCSSSSISDPSRWTVTIPKIETRVDNNLKYFHVFSIEVQRHPDEEEEEPKMEEMVDFDETLTCDGHNNGSQWMVERRYPEFYELESRIKGFHGDNLISNVDFITLPSRKTFPPRLNVRFLESKRIGFERFLQSVVSSNRLKGSQLVYNFLKSPEEQFKVNILPEIHFKTLMKSVPAKLTLEKGQNLDPFINSVIEGIQSPKSKASQPDLNQLLFNEAPDEFSKSLLMKLPFGDNFSSVREVESRNSSRNQSVSSYGVDNGSDIFLDCKSGLSYDDVGHELVHSPSSSASQVFEYFLFIATRIMSLSSASKFLKSFLTLECLIRSSLQEFVHQFTSSSLRSKLASPRVVVKLITLLKDALYSSSGSTPNSDEDERGKKMRREEALQCLITSLKTSTDLLNNILESPVDEHWVALTTFSLFQLPVLNKQLMYTWLDQVLKHVFPQIVIPNKE